MGSYTVEHSELEEEQAVSQTAMVCYKLAWRVYYKRRREVGK